jgi:hypothetical protein
MDLPTNKPLQAHPKDNRLLLIMFSSTILVLITRREDQVWSIVYRSEDII